MNKKLLITAIAVTVIGGGLLNVSAVSAHENGMGDSTFISSIVQKIADKFKLNKGDVQAVFDEEKKTRMAEMESKYVAQLDQYVKDGKITDAQKQLILAKRKELEAKRQAQTSKENLTQEQRKTEMETQRTELQTWATQNGIDIQYLMGLRMKGHGFKK